MTAKKCTKKGKCTCKIVVLLIKPIAFVLFPLSSLLQDLKVPNNSNCRTSCEWLQVFGCFFCGVAITTDVTNKIDKKLDNCRILIHQKFLSATLRNIDVTFRAAIHPLINNGVYSDKRFHVD